MEFPQRRTACRTPRRGGSLALASVAALPWHQRQRSPGIGGRRARASVAAFVWNTQVETSWTQKPTPERGGGGGRAYALS